jgi:hypothetical protein
MCPRNRCSSRFDSLYIQAHNGDMTTHTITAVIEAVEAGKLHPRTAAKLTGLTVANILNLWALTARSR